MYPVSGRSVCLHFDQATISRVRKRRIWIDAIGFIIRYIIPMSSVLCVNFILLQKHLQEIYAVVRGYTSKGRFGTQGYNYSGNVGSTPSPDIGFLHFRKILSHYQKLQTSTPLFPVGIGNLGFRQIWTQHPKLKTHCSHPSHPPLGRFGLSANSWEPTLSCLPSPLWT